MRLEGGRTASGSNPLSHGFSESTLNVHIFFTCCSLVPCTYLGREGNYENCCIKVSSNLIRQTRSDHPEPTRESTVRLYSLEWRKEVEEVSK